MDQSELYKNVLQYAADMCRKDGKSSISADYFLAALLNIVLAESRAELDGIPEIQIRDMQSAKAEIEAVRNILSRYKTDIMDAAVRLEAEVRGSADDYSLGMKFAHLQMNALMRAQSNGKDLLTTDMILAAMLEEPTAFVSKYITSGTRGESERTAPAPSPEQDDGKRENSGYADSDEKGMFAGERPKRPVPMPQPTSGSGNRFGLNTHDGNNMPPEQPAQPQQPTQPPHVDALMEHAKKVKDVQGKLLDKVFGQDLAVEMFVSGYFQAELVSMLMQKRRKPRATFLFAGPPGVGKTFLAECSAEVLGLPYKRFDMSEYSHNEANLEFAGTDKVYKGSHPGLVTSFVDQNPRCIILFDEVEKAHINIIHLFLQILDAGRIRDSFTEQEVDFSNTILIFTTNAGKRLYEDPDIVNLSGVPRKTVLRAIADDTRPDGSPFFPAAICSRFAAGNVVMFNHLGAHDLLQIAGKEMAVHADLLHEKTGVKIEIGDDINYAVLYSEGGKADARAIRGKAVNFFYRELYEFYRLASAEKNANPFDTIRIKVEKSDDPKISELFSAADNTEVLVFTDGETARTAQGLLSSVRVHVADDLEKAKTIIVENDISIILCDVKCNQRSGRRDVLNLEDIDSAGRDFFNYVSQNVNIPLYVLGGNYDITGEELMSFSRNGAMGVISLGDDFAKQVTEKCNIAKQQRSMLDLARSRKVLSYQSAQSFTDGGKTAEIVLFDLKLTVAVDAEDGDSILNNVSRPDVTFADVIGAEDAKRELGYFTEFLKNPKLFAKNGVRPPKGILLYGPPGTGKTLLAKALAGESEVTYIAAEGNSFLSKWVGEGPAKVHELFATARKYAPAVLFIDEIDAIGISRADLSADNDSTSEILTAFLTEMDGFKSHPDRPIFVLAATNIGVDGSDRKQLDPALLRRFDRRIMVDLPNKAEREQFIRMQAAKNANIKVSDSQISNIAMRSTGMSLADLASIMEMALRDSLKNPDFAVTDETIEEAFETYNSGEVKKWNDDTLVRTARHEAGHALMCWLGGETPSYLTIVARDNHGGYMQHADGENKQVYTKQDLLNLVRTSLGGRAAEVAYYGKEDGVTTGPSSDLQHATRTVEQLICTYGMDEQLGLGCVDLSKLMYTPYYSVVRERTNRILAEQFDITVKAISDNKHALDLLVEALLQKNKLRGEEIDEILKGSAKR